MALETMDLALVKNSGFLQFEQVEWWWRGRPQVGARLAWLAMQDNNAGLV